MNKWNKWRFTYKRNIFLNKYFNILDCHHSVIERDRDIRQWKDFGPVWKSVLKGFF